MQREAAQQQFERDIQSVFTAGGGCMTLIIIGPTTAASVIAAVMADDAAAKLVLAATDRLLRRIQRRSRTNAMPCALCTNNTLWRGEAPAAIGLLRPYGVDLAPVAVGMAFCSDCADGRAVAELAQTVVAQLRDGWLPDLRVLAPMAEAGHA